MVLKIVRFLVVCSSLSGSLLEIVWNRLPTDRRMRIFSRGVSPAAEPRFAFGEFCLGTDEAVIGFTVAVVMVHDTG